MTITPERLGRIGVWARELRFHPDAGEIADAASELEELGYGTLWIPDVGGDVFGAVDLLLDATTTTTVATGILNIWTQPAAEVAPATMRRAQSGRFALGLGASHAALIDRYDKPLTAMRGYLDALDTAEPPVPVGERLLAALGPKMLELSGTRAAGAHPYLVPVEHTRLARGILGPDPVLAPELAVVLDADHERGMQRAREHVAGYLELPNYANNLRRLDFAEEDLADGGSDRLVEALVAVGDAETIAARVAEHLEAGADHVCIQAVGPMGQPLPRETWRGLAQAVLAVG
jgi:probable F420-dependent oxidoreductase